MELGSAIENFSHCHSFIYFSTCISKTVDIKPQLWKKQKHWLVFRTWLECKINLFFRFACKTKSKAKVQRLGNFPGFYGKSIVCFCFKVFLAAEVKCLRRLKKAGKQELFWIHHIVLDLNGNDTPPSAANKVQITWSCLLQTPDRKIIKMAKL